MKIKLKYIVYFFIIIVLLFSIIFSQYNTLYKIFRPYVPKSVIKILKVIDNQENQANEISKLKSEITKLNEQFSSFLAEQDIFIGEVFNNRKVSLINNNDLYLKKYYAPFIPYYYFDQKPVAYVEKIQNNRYFFVSGNGNTKLIENLDPSENFQIFKKIPNNLKEIIKNKNIFRSSWFSIKDLLIYNNIIYISYNKKVKEECYNTSILHSEINFEELRFSEFFTYPSCISSNSDSFNAHQSGGKLEIIDNSKLLLSIGDYRSYKTAQNPKSFFGKIFSIDLDTNKYEILSSGHRNPQGLFFDKLSELIFSTEHGPKGGDEINIIYKDHNYGWPISSYGEHYDGIYKKNAPLYKSHSDYNFEEPIKYFTPSIGISEIRRIPKKFGLEYDNAFFVTSLKGESVYLMVFNSDYTEVQVEKTITVGDRIRDLIYDEDHNVFMLILENAPGIAILSNNIFYY